MWILCSDQYFRSLPGLKLMVNNKLINLITNKTDGGKRIDQFISQNSELSRQRISNLITNGYIFLNDEV